MPTDLRSDQDSLISLSPVASTSTSFAAPKSPRGPPPSGKATRPRPHLSASFTELVDKPARIVLKDLASPRPPPEMASGAALGKKLSLETRSRPPAQACKSAMAMDLDGQEAVAIPY